MVDRRTADFYDAHARDYGAAFGQTPSPTLQRFIADLPKGARVLDLGCGPGHAARHMAAAGLRPDPVDASPAMVALAREAGLEARVMLFAQLDAVAAYDGIWANFSLTHAPRADLPAHLAAMATALRPGGQVHIAMKTGAGPYRDRLGRLYHLIGADALAALVAGAGLRETRRREGVDTGFDGAQTGFVVMRAVKDD